MPSARSRIVYAVIMIALIAGEIVDVLGDFLREGFTIWLCQDVALLLLVSVGVTYILYTSAADLRGMHIHLEQARQDVASFRSRNQDAIVAMREAILSQFSVWGFTPAESRIADLLIRGYSSRQIAGMLGRSERTVRNQTLAIYRKSGMTGRSDLSAFFLQDIMGEEKEFPAVQGR